MPTRPTLTRLMKIDPLRRQSFISLVSALGLTIVGFIATMYFAHVLGKTAYGAYALFLAYYGVFSLISDGGFGGAAVKRISERNEPDEFYTAFFVMRITLLAVSIVALLIIRPHLIDLENSGMVGWLFLALIISSIPSIITTGVYGTGMVGVHQTASLLNSITKVIIQILAVFLGFSAAGLAGGFIAGTIIGGLFCLPFLKLHLTRFTTRHIKSLFSLSFWIFLSGSGAVVFSYADTILVGYFLSTADVGLYRIAFQFTTAATFTTIALSTSLYPKISQWHTEGSLSLIGPSLSRAFTYSLLLAVPVAVGGWILGEPLLYFLYGAGFAEGADALRILLLVQVVNVFMLLQTTTLTATGRPRESFYATGTAAIVNIMLNLILIPSFGIEGAAIATFVTVIVNVAISRHYLSRLIPVKTEHNPTTHIFTAAGVMALVVLLYKLLIPLSNAFIVLGAVVIGALVYGIAILKTDPGLHDEIRDLVVELGVFWPRWL